MTAEELIEAGAAIESERGARVIGGTRPRPRQSSLTYPPSRFTLAVATVCVAVGVLGTLVTGVGRRSVRTVFVLAWSSLPVSSPSLSPLSHFWCAASRRQHRDRDRAACCPRLRRRRVRGCTAPRSSCRRTRRRLRSPVVVVSRSPSSSVSRSPVVVEPSRRSSSSTDAGRGLVGRGMNLGTAPGRKRRRCGKCGTAAHERSDRSRRDLPGQRLANHPGTPVTCFGTCWSERAGRRNGYGARDIHVCAGGRAYPPNHTNGIWGVDAISGAGSSRAPGPGDALASARPRCAPSSAPFRGAESNPGHDARSDGPAARRRRRSRRRSVHVLELRGQRVRSRHRVCRGRPRRAAQSSKHCRAVAGNQRADPTDRLPNGNGNGRTARDPAGRPVA